MKTVSRLIILILLETIIFWLLFKDIEPSVSIGLIILIPVVFFINLIVAALLYLVFKKGGNWYVAFLINSIIGSAIIYYVFSAGIVNHERKTMSSWSFIKGDTTYSIIIWKKTKEYDISYSLERGSSMSYLSGTYQQTDSELFLKDSSKNYILRNDYLIGFGSENDSVKLVSVVK